MIGELEPNAIEIAPTNVIEFILMMLILMS